MKKELPSGDGLLEILGWARPHNSETERRFCVEFLDKVPGMAKDDFGNRMLDIGDKPRTMWSCHVDTVAAKGGPQLLKVGEDGMIGLKKGKAGMSLGSDDGVGVWIMLEMIAAKRPGRYVFHRGEEVGCLGSAWIKKHTPELLAGLDAAVAFDRAGYTDIITHQSYGRTCSDAFAKSFADQLNGLESLFDFKPCDQGIYTDTNEYAGIIPECSNISVGYFGQHGPRETQSLPFARLLLRAMLNFDATKLPIERDPSVHDYDDWGWGRPKEKRDPLVTLIEEFPQLAAELLRDAGLTTDDFEQLALEMMFEDEPRTIYRPLAAA